MSNMGKRPHLYQHNMFQNTSSYDQPPIFNNGTALPYAQNPELTSNMVKRPRPNEHDEAPVCFAPQNTSSYQIPIFDNGTAVTYAPNRPVLSLNLKECDSKTPPLGLKLEKATVKLIRKTMNCGYRETKKKKQESLKDRDSAVDIFPATGLEIGEYKFVATHYGSLMTCFNYATRKVWWEIFEVDSKTKYKIEIEWQNILTMQASLRENSPGILGIEVVKAPTMFHHFVGPNARAHPQWKPTNDFTGGSALRYRRYYFEFASGCLDQFYRKLTESDNKLMEISQQPFPRLTSPFF